MRLKKAAIAASLAAALAAFPIASALGAPETDEPDIPALRQALQDTVDAGAPGALARIDDQSGAYREAKGVADLDTGEPVDAGGQFRIGSATKTFTTVLVMKLVEEGELELDSSVNSYLPDLLPDDKITVRHLLAHRSGLHDYTNDMFKDTVPGFEAVRNKVFTLQELLDLSLESPLNFTPGEEYGYSNTNFVVAGMLVEKVSGQRLKDAYQERIFNPLGLRNSSYVTPSVAIPGPHANGYLTPDQEGEPLVDATEQTVSWAQPAGAVISDGADLNRFFSALMRGELVGADLLEEMQNWVPSDSTGKAFYGLGLRKRDLSCGVSVYGHTGAVQGYYTYAFTAEDGSRSVAASATASNNGEVLTALGDTLEAAFCGSDTEKTDKEREAEIRIAERTPDYRL